MANDNKLTIEDIILQDDMRAVSGLRPYLSADFVTESAELLLERKGTVMITTGFYILSAKSAETDGPPGAVALATALREIGSEPVFVTDEYSSKVLAALSTGIEVVEFPITNHFQSAEFANNLLKEYAPSALVSIERAGLAKDGTYRNMRNVDISEWTARIDHLFDQHPYSIGIGDGGNEIGMGNLFKVIPDVKGLHENPSVTTTTCLVIASCSNWGGFGVIAAMSRRTGRNLLPSPEEVERMVEQCIKAGAVDGFSGDSKAWVDGKSPEEDGVCLRNLHEVLKAEGI